MILKVARLGHPVLRSPAKAVPPEEIRTSRFQAFLDDMVETMREYEGVGLAATQVHVPSLAAVIEVAREHPRYPGSGEVPLTFLINPVIVDLSSDTALGWEGCLSVPDLRGRVPRHKALVVRALGRDAKPLEIKAEGLFARIIQHECDHLAGGVYLDRMPDLKTLSFLKEYARYWEGR